MGRLTKRSIMRTVAIILLIVAAIFWKADIHKWSMAIGILSGLAMLAFLISAGYFGLKDKRKEIDYEDKRI